jgi:hypothetical protein
MNELRAVSVIFQSQRNEINPRQYTYKVMPGMKLAVGDPIVVPILDDMTLKVGVVVTEGFFSIMSDPTYKGEYRWVVQKIDLIPYINCLEMEEVLKINENKNKPKITRL